MNTRSMAVVALCMAGLAAPAHAQNQPPNAVIRTNPAADAGSVLAGYSPMTVTFNSCMSTDPDNDPLKYAFDLDADGTFETMGTCRFTVTYHAATMAGKRVTACVDDRTNFDGHRICKSFYLFSGPTEAQTGAARTLYAVSGAVIFRDSGDVAALTVGGDTLLRVDAATAAVTAIGSTGFTRTSALEASAGGKLYAVASSVVETSEGAVGAFDCANTQVLVEIDPATGAGSEVGRLFPDGGGDVCGEISDLAFDGGTLVGLVDGSVYTINTATGAATLAVDEIDEESDGGLADRSGTVYYGSRSETIYSVNVGAGSAAPTGAVLDYTALPDVTKPVLRSMTNGNAMNGVVEVVGADAAAEVGSLTVASSFRLVEIDLATGRVTQVAEFPLETWIRGLAWSR